LIMNEFTQEKQDINMIKMIRKLKIFLVLMMIFAIFPTYATPWDNAIIQGQIVRINMLQGDRGDIDVRVTGIIKDPGYPPNKNPRVGSVSIIRYLSTPISLAVGDCIEARGYWETFLAVDPISQGHVDYIKKIACRDDQGPEPTCTPGPLGSPQCSGNTVRQLYQDANCNQYWQTVDDCNRYIPSKCCTNGACQKCGEQETYRCVNNVVQRLVINNGVGEWQVFDDCNRYDPPRRCIGGVCIKIDDPTPEECDQAECQSQNGPIGVPYQQSGKRYQRYNECNCTESECICDTIEKEVAKTEIKFLGTAIKKHTGSMPGEPDYWTVKVDEIITGPRYSGELNVITDQAINEIWGQEDPEIKEGYQVEVYGEYQKQENSDYRVVLYGSYLYYIKRTIRIARDCSYIAGQTLSGEEAYWRYRISAYPPNGPTIYYLPQMITSDVCYEHKFGSEVVTGGYIGFKAILELWNGDYKTVIGSNQENEAKADRDCLGGCTDTRGIDDKYLQVRLPEGAPDGWYDARIRLYYSLRYPLNWQLADEVLIENVFIVKHDSPAGS